MAQIIHYSDAAATLERDRAVFRLRLHGASVRTIAVELKITTDEVDAALTRMCGGVTPAMRERTIQIELDRLDEMQRAHYAKAVEGDIEHTAISLKIMEHRARMLGLIAPPRTDDWLSRALEANRESTTDRIRRALDLIAGGKEIDGEVVKEKTPDE